MVVLVTLIGDMVGSRSLPDRAGVQRRLAEALDEATALLGPAQRLETTVGDEFQGAFDDVGTASLAALVVRLALLPEVDVRCGLGQGEVTVHDPSSRPLLQDGPGWWAARAALEELARPRRSAARTWFEGPDRAAAAGLNAFLLTRDALVDRLGDRGLRLLAASLRGATQADIAASEGISRSAVSQQFSRGVGAVRDAQALIVPPRGEEEDDT